MPSATERRRRRDAGPAAGFTILETVIALFVALIVGFGALSLFLFSAKFNAGAADRARAVALAQQRMERLRASTYASLATGDTTEQVTLGSTNAGEADARPFTVRTRIEYDTAVPNNRQRKITVTVTPTGAGSLATGGVTLMLLRASSDVGTN